MHAKEFNVHQTMFSRYLRGGLICAISYPDEGGGEVEKRNRGVGRSVADARLHTYLDNTYTLYKLYTTMRELTEAFYRTEGIFRERKF